MSRLLVINCLLGYKLITISCGQRISSGGVGGGGGVEGKATVDMMGKFPHLWCMLDASHPMELHQLLSTMHQTGSREFESRGKEVMSP